MRHVAAVIVRLSSTALLAHAQVAPDLRKERPAVVARRVADAAGEPVIGATVAAESATDRAPVRRRVAVAQTDDRGEFRLHGLPTGQYLVRATLLISTATAAEGRFRVRGLPPGDYYAATLIDPPAGDWHDPDLLDTLIPTATRVVVAAGEAVTIGLRARPR